MVLVDLRRISPDYLQKTWKKLQRSSDLRRVGLLEGLIVDEESGRVKKLDLYKKGLAGEIPTSIGELRMLTSLQLSRNDLSGRIPDSLGQLQSLQELYLYRNELEGSIPACICELKGLKELSIHSNSFTGAIPDFTGLPKLRTLNLANNALKGEMPLSLIRLKISGCKVFTAKNELRLPSNIGLLGDAVEVLDLSECGLSGPVPESLGQCCGLKELYLNDNQLSGELPSALSGLVKLSFLDASCNSLIGAIPPLSSELVELNLADNNLSGSLGRIGSSTCLPKLASLDVSNNSALTGQLEPAFLRTCKGCRVAGCAPELEAQAPAPVYAVDLPPIGTGGIEGALEGKADAPAPWFGEDPVADRGSGVQTPSLLSCSCCTIV